MRSRSVAGHPVRVISDTLDDHEALELCNDLLQEAIIQIRGMAYLHRQVGRSVGDVEVMESIRRLADMCDGLPGPEAGATARLNYRLSTLSDEQTQWVQATLAARGHPASE